MTVLSRGANASLQSGLVEVAVSGARQGSVDLMVFQLAADRKVRSDADFVFFNQPTSSDGSVRLVAADQVTADLSAVSADIETLAIAVALDDAVPGSLAGIPGLGVTVSGVESHRADASGLTDERAAVLVEIYRKAGGWKVRNVSAGWAAGLPALAGEHGVSVDQAPSPAPPRQPTAAAPFLPVQPPAAVDPAVALPPAVLPPAAIPRPSVPAAARGNQPGYPTPGGFPPPGGSLPLPPDFVPPRPGGWPAPGGSLAGRP